jgi:hypothetical protein
MDYMNVDASDSPWNRSNKIPLDSARSKIPGFPEDFSERTSAILVRNERTPSHAIRKGVHIYILSIEGMKSRVPLSLEAREILTCHGYNPRSTHRILVEED